MKIFLICILLLVLSIFSCRENKNTVSGKEALRPIEQSQVVYPVFKEDFSAVEKKYIPLNSKYKNLLPVSDLFGISYFAAEVIPERANKIIKVREPEKSVYLFYKLYDSNGRLDKIVDINENNGGVIATRIKFYYNDNNSITRIVALNYKDEVSIFCMDGYSTVNIVYDDQNRIIEEYVTYGDSELVSANGRGYENKIRFIYNSSDYIDTIQVYAPDGELVNELLFDEEGNKVSQLNDIPVGQW